MFESWEKCLNGIEVELVGEGKTLSLLGLEPTIKAHHLIVQEKHEGLDLGALGGVILEEGMILEQLGLLGSETITCVESGI